MTFADFVVAAVALAAIIWVNWYFLISGRRLPAARAQTVDGVQEVQVMVRGGYQPRSIAVDRGRRVRLVFDRQEDNPCTEEVVLGAFGIRRHLPAFTKTAIEFTPDKPGDFDFACGMGMLHGRLVVR